MEAVAAADMDFNALSRRELQALCKLNGVRANMTNLAMVEALHSLPSVDGIDQIGTTLCLPTPGKSAMKSSLRAAAAEDQQQQGSPLPRARRVSIQSPEAIRMDGEDEMKRDLFKEIVRTPGVALRSTSRRPRATPAPVPTPAAGTTLRRSQRSTARKATAPVETAKRSTRKTAKLNMAVFDFDQDEEDAVAREQEVEPKGVTSVVKRDGPEEDEPEQGEEVVSSFAPIESADKSCDNSKVEEGAAIGEEQKLVNAEKFPMEDSPILGVLSNVAPEPAMMNVENASTEDGEGFGNWSPVLEIADEINSATEDKEDAAVEVPKEVVKEDAFSPTVEAADAPDKMILAANESPQADPIDDERTDEYDLDGERSDEVDLTEESSEEDDLDEDEDASEDKEDAAFEVPTAASEDKEDAAFEVPKEAVKEALNSTVEATYEPNKMIPAALTEKEVTADEFPQAESGDEYDLDGERSDEADLTEESSEEDDLDVNLTVGGESDETIEASNSTEVNFDSDEEEELKMTGEEIKEYEESYSLTGEEDDFSADLSSEFDNVDDFSDAETESNNSHVALEGIHAAASSSAANTDGSAITEEGDEVSQHVDTIVESLDKVTITEEKKEECAKEKKQLKVGKEMSLRKLKSAYKESLIAAKEGKKLSTDAEECSRVVLAELDDNVEC